MEHDTSSDITAYLSNSGDIYYTFSNREEVVRRIAPHMKVSQSTLTKDDLEHAVSLLEFRKLETPQGGYKFDDDDLRYCPLLKYLIGIKTPKKMSSDKQAVDRYRPEYYSTININGMKSSDEGNYVLYTDYEKLAAEVERLREALQKIADTDGKPMSMRVCTSGELAKRALERSGDE